MDDINGNAGNDYLIGGDGVDTYGFAAGFGNDTITGANDNVQDQVDFSSFQSSEASVSTNGNNLIITIGSDTLTIVNWGLGAGYQLNSFSFSDGVKSTNGSGWL